MKKHIAIILSIVMIVSIIPVFSFAGTALPAPKLYNHSASITSARNFWSKVDGAQGYQLYRATKKKGKYTRIITTSKASYVDKKLKYHSSIYYYKVRAYKKVGEKTQYSKFSNIESIWPSEQPDVTISLIPPTSPAKYITIKVKNKGMYDMEMFGDIGYSDRDDLYLGYMHKSSTKENRVPRGKTEQFTYKFDYAFKYSEKNQFSSHFVFGEGIYQYSFTGQMLKNGYVEWHWVDYK